MGSRCPRTQNRFRSVCRLTDIAITRRPPRTLSWCCAAMMRWRSGRGWRRAEISQRDIAAQAMRASLLASAAAACLRSFVASSPLSPGSRGSYLLRTAAITPVSSNRRRYPLPRLLIRPSHTVPPVPVCRGTRPSEAENSRPLL